MNEDRQLTILLWFVVITFLACLSVVIVYHVKYYRYQKKGGKLSYVEFLEKQL